MKISKEAKDYVEAKFNKYLNTAQKNLAKSLKPTSMPSPIKSYIHESNTQHRIKYIKRLIKKKVSLYIQAYKKEGQIIDQADYDEMMEEFEIIVESPIRNIGTEYTNVFSGLSPEQANGFEEKLKWGCRSALGIAKRKLDIAMAEMRLKEKERMSKKSTPVDGFISDPKIST